MLPTHGHEGRVDRKLLPALAPPPTHQHQTSQAFRECNSTRDRTNLSSSMSDQLSTIPDPRSHSAELRSRRFREGGRVRASKVKDGSSLQRNSEEWESAACWTTVTGKEDKVNKIEQW
ncbi:hypothetical protein ARMGADRAFT_1035635 [Armillaria gallica]|uniref:Uncharacterized protein n=1 Tax=Armillaria gallica TaxID=47427 RepID=A0A2H3D6M5_ARMGA|nr:hypothetical protein ARMGADRAFT_1035635 [Armillaria gallica]